MKIKFSMRQKKGFIVEMPAVPSVGDVIVVSNMGGIYPGSKGTKTLAESSN